MSAFNLMEYNNINKMLNFKKNNPPEIDYDINNNLCYTSWCISKYYTRKHCDYVVITYTYWHHNHVYNECIQNEVILGHEYDVDVQEDWCRDGDKIICRYNRSDSDEY